MMSNPFRLFVGAASGAALLGLGAAASAQTTFLTSPNRTVEGIYGGAISSVPDLNGDGRDDVLVGAPGETVSGVQGAGRVYVYSGTTGQLLRTLVSPTPWTGGGFGTAVSGVPDTNGDARGDIAIGAPGEPFGSALACGKAYIFNGASGALISTMISVGRETGGNFGISIAGMADCTGDGRGDVAVGASGENPGTSPANCGRAYIYRGNGTLWQRVLPPFAMDDGNFGAAVGAVPDADGDGRGDLVVGAPRVRHWPQYNEPVNSGRAYLISGATGRSLRHYRSPALTEHGFFGASVAGMTDINGDNRGDVVIGAPGDEPGNGTSPNDVGRAYVYSGGTGQYIRVLIPPFPQASMNFGFSVSGVPDTSGDGRADILVGAWQQTWPNPPRPSMSGVTHLFNGVTGQRIDSYLSPQAQVGGRIGGTVAGLRDVNATGRGDIITGAAGESPGGTTAAGNAYIFRR